MTAGVGIGPRPLTKQRSPWVEVPADQLGGLLGLRRYGARVFQRSVSDGHLSVIVAEEPAGWHLSISHRSNSKRPKPGRYPRWDEITHARYELLPVPVDVVMHLPPRAEYVAVHDTTFHLHEHPPR